ncbi:MAG TPA: MFS transporter [Nevskiaceae bacterium]|nr:MFS transporter [Nevskiaceae bacterium]
MTSRSSVAPYLMLGIAFLGQSVAIGLTYGSFGLLVEPVSHAFDSGRAVGSLPIALIAIVSGLLSPLIGHWMDRWSLRSLMAIGCVAGAGGFALAARADSAGMFIVGYGVLVGVAFAMMGTLASNKIANAWFPQRLGWASGFANLPLANALVPPLFAWILVAYGWRHLLDVFAVIFLVMLCITFFVRKPETGTAPSPAAAPRRKSPPQTAQIKAPYRVGAFWIIVIASGLLQTSGIVAITHLVAYAQGLGAVETRASLLLSVFGLCGVGGALVFGWLADHLTPASALMLNGALQVALWLGIVVSPEFTVLLVLAGALGFCTGGEFPLCAALLGTVFSSRQFGSALGQLMLLGCPFNFIAAPLAGYLFDRTGNYHAAFIVEAALCAIGIGLLWACRRRFRAKGNTAVAAAG